MTRRFVFLLPLAGCVLDPVWGDDPTRRDPIDFNGMASRASAPIRIQAWNHGASAFEDVANLTGTANQWAADPDLFGWSRVNVMLAERFWVPPGAPCSTTGMANLRVQERNTDGTFSELATFDAAGKDCLDDHLAAGDHPVAAGRACKLPDARFVLFAPPQCVPARTSDATPPLATIRLTDNVRAWHRDSGSSDLVIGSVSRTLGLTAMAMLRDRDGAARAVQLAGGVDVQCRRSDGSLLAVPTVVGGARTQTITDGVAADIGLEVSRFIDVNRIVTATCPTGTTFVRADGNVTASGTNAANTPVTSPMLRFTI